MALVTFSDDAVLVQELTRNLTKVTERIRALVSQGATALHDGIHVGVQEVASAGGRRMVLVFTDGRDQNRDGTAPQSSRSAKVVAQLARDSGVPLWTVGIGDADEMFLKKIAQVTGGQHYHPRHASLLRTAFGRVLADVRLQYRLLYRTPNEKRNGTERTLAIVSQASGQRGQGKGRYRSPLPAPPPPSPAPVESEGDAAQNPEDSPATPSTVVTVSVGKIRFVGWNYFGSHYLAVWPASMSFDTAMEKSKLKTAGSDLMLSLPAGKWSVGAYLPGETGIDPMATVDLKTGTEVVVRNPTGGK